MERYLALLRGINVGGIILKMDDLKQLLQRLGFRSIQTYIQSGNAIFESEKMQPDKLEIKIQEAIFREKNLNIEVIIKTKNDIRKIIREQPFKKTDEQFLYVTFLKTKPDIKQFEEIIKLIKLNNENEEFILLNDIIYSCYGNGYGKSKHNNNFFENKLKIKATTRNWNTLKKISDMFENM